MRKIIVEICNGVNGVPFGCPRDKARKSFGRKYKEMKKNMFSENTMDAYESYHVFFSKVDLFEAIEIFDKTKTVIGGTVVFPGNVANIRKMFPELICEGDSWIDKKNSIAIVVDQDDDSKIESILIGRKGYYDS